MSERYDAIVVGAGLGGLSAAAFLARAGRRVRLLERHVQPGGYASTFVRGRFEFEVSLHALSGVGSAEDRGDLWPVLAELGITEEVEFLPIAPLYRVVAPGLDLRIPPGWEAATDVFCAAFPHERAGFTALMKHLRALHGEVLDMTARLGTSPNPAEVMTRYPLVAHAALTPLGPTVDRALRDPLAKLAFCQLWAYFGLPPSRCSLLYFAVGFASYLRWGATYPRGKSQTLSNAFVRAIERAGGEVTLGCGVTRLLVQGDRVTGVVTDREEQLLADAVVSNASPITTCRELLPEGLVPERYLRRLATSHPSLGSVCVFLGLAKPAATLGLVDHEVFISRSPDMDAHYRSYLQAAPPESMLLGCYSATDPDFSPRGTSVAVLVSLADGRAWQALRSAEYPQAKERVALAMLEDAESLFPGLRDAVEVVEVSTPLTNFRYTANPLGAIYGFANTPEDHPGMRPDHRGPLEGLWFVGAWTRPGGGYQPCITSGVLAARRILRSRHAWRRGRRGALPSTTAGEGTAP